MGKIFKRKLLFLRKKMIPVSIYNLIACIMMQLLYHSIDDRYSVRIGHSRGR